MFLKNVPPVVALHTEWRSHGPTRSFSLPLCFNDSDSDISTTGTPIPEKVQMIIDSLRSTQSSIDMSDEYEGTLQAGQAPPPGFPSKTADVLHKARCSGALEGDGEDNQCVDCMELGPQSQDSDSDDSVDRGIEEAIQEYLKEKGDHKRKLEPAASPTQVSKQPKRELPLSVTPKNSDSNKILTVSSNHIPQSVTATHSLATEKKCIRNERPSEGNPLLLKKGDISKAVKKSPSFEIKNNSVNLTSHPYKEQNLISVKLEGESPDSSSDDGIEEAIRDYQLEKKKENSDDSKKLDKLLQLNEESDSSSDDGIEEAIRHYQLEKQKEEHVTKVSELSQPKQTHGSKATALGLDHSGTPPIKKQKVLTKKKKSERNSKPVLSTPVAACCTFSRPLDNLDVKDHSGSLTKNKIPSEKSTPAPLKVNTTAELMCAEAILDISKAVMPEVIDERAALPKNCAQSTLHSQDYMNCFDKKSDESSFDSDDGIELEIRKFLELKAQMHSQSSGTTSFACTQAHAMTSQQPRKLDPSQNKKLRLSLSHKRKCKEEDGNISKEEELDTKLKEPHLQPLTACDSSMLQTQVSTTPEETAIALHVATNTKMEGPTKNGEQKHSPISLKDAKDPGKKGDSHPSSSKDEVSKSLTLAERRAQTEDKSSSLDSDEDLDAAIKDLLLTKKKVKKKTRDRKLKSKKVVHFGAIELCLVEELQSEKKKTLTEYKTVSSPKIPKSCISKCNKVTPKQNANGRSIKPKLNKNSEQLRTDKQVKPSCQVEQTGQEKGHTDAEPLSGGSSVGATQVEEDSSSVDSDDSIEQEIRKFLAEKAKLSMVKTKDGMEIRDSSTNTTDSRTEGGIKVETQQAEILEGEALQRASPCLEGHIPHSVDKQSSLMVANTSNSSSGLQADREGNTLKALKRNRVILKKSNAEKISADVEKVATVHEVSPVSPSSNTETIFAHQAIPLTEMVVPMSQSPFHISPPTPMRVREVKETSISDLHGVIRSHQARSFVPSHDASGSICLGVGNHENITQDEIIELSPQFPETSTAAGPSFPALTPARQPSEHFLLGQARGGSLGQKTSSCLRDNVVQIKMDQPLFLELSSHGSNYVQIRNRDLCKAGNNKDCTRETEDRNREAGDLVREGEEECIDETDDESDERSRASQRSREREQFPSLFLSTTIDPGESFRPYIILSSSERNLKYSKRCVWVDHQQSDQLKMPAASHKPMTPKKPERINANYAVNVETFYSKITPSAVPLTKKAKKKKLFKRQLQFYTQLPRK